MARTATGARKLRTARVVALLAVLSVAVACDDDAPPTPIEPTPTPTSDAEAPDSGMDANREDVPATKGDRDRLDALVAALASASNATGRADLVAAFARAVAYGERGFPIRERGEITFVYWDGAEVDASLAVAGDFDAWSTTATPMKRPVTSAPLYVATVPDPAPSSRSLYKFVRSSTTFFADPWARRFGYDENGEHALLGTGATDGYLERWPDFGDKRGPLDARALVVWLPPAYDPKATPGYPLLVMQDGQNLFDPSAPHGGWRASVAANDGVKGGALRPFVIVAVPSSTRRFYEYTHTTDTIPNVGKVGGQADAYTSFVADGIVPFARARYRLRAEAAETAIAGSSLGGLVSLHAAQRRPDVFGHAASFSGTISWGSIGESNPTIRDRYAATPPIGLRLYLDSGGDDGGGCATLSALDSEVSHDQYCETRGLRDLLLGRGWSLGTSLVYAWTLGAAHDEAAWAARLPNAFATWFPRK